MNTEIVLIAAVAADGGIGHGQNLLFRISADMRRFKELTMGHPIIMGRKTFESFPNGPLPGRKNIVITRQKGYGAGKDIVVAGSVAEALEAAGAGVAMVIGGGEIYNQFMPYAHRLEITRVHSLSPEGTDVFFPEIDAEKWRLAEDSVIETDTRSGMGYTYQTYVLR